MKKLLSFALVLTMLLVFAFSAMATPSYDSTVYVNITPDDKAIVLAGEAVDVTFTVEITNISKSGDLPQITVTPLGDNTEGIAAITNVKIVNKSTAVFTFTVTYTEVGDYDFWVNIKNMQGNSGKWNYEFTTNAVTVSVIEPPETLPEGFEFTDDGLLISKDALGIGDFAANGKTVTVFHDGIDLSVNSDANASNSGIQIKFKVLDVGVYVITNTETGLIFSFEIVKLDGNKSIINIL